MESFKAKSESEYGVEEMIEKPKQEQPLQSGHHWKIYPSS
jgi:hypothetical protein